MGFDERTCLKDKHSFFDYIYWLLVLSVPVVTASIAMYRLSIFWFVGYLVVSGGLVAVFMRVFCSHCPHYDTGAKTLRCMFFWGFPKVFQARPGQLKMWEKAVTVIAAAFLFLLLPAPGLLEHPELLTVYVLSLGVLLLSVLRNECGRCTYAECMLNRVAPEDFHAG